MQKPQNGLDLLLVSFCIFMFFSISLINSTQPIIVSPQKTISIVHKTFQEIVNDTPSSNRDEAIKNPDQVVKIDLCTGNYGFKSDINTLLQEISQYTNLKYLELCRIPIRTVPQEISNLKNLEYIHNIDGYLTSIPSAVGYLTRLKYLSLSSNRITVIADSFGNLQNLEELDLSFNPLTDFPPVILKLNKLKILSILGTQISRLPDEIKNMPSLEELDIRNTQITQDEIDRITKILPSHIKLIY
jgi:Leucine-rich repeat (LRR) protein